MPQGVERAGERADGRALERVAAVRPPFRLVHNPSIERSLVENMLVRFGGHFSNDSPRRPTAMSDAEAPGAGRNRAGSVDLAAAVASAMEGADAPLVSPGAADALAALEAVGGGEHAADPEQVEVAASAAEDALALGDASMFEGHLAELARWLDECRAAGGGGEATHDDVFFFFETTYPEVLDHLPQLFHWISVFMDRLAPDPLFLDAQEAGRPIPSWVPDAVARLEATGDLATVATESGLKSPVTLLYWKNEHAKRELQREHDSHRALGDLAAAQTEEQQAEGAAAAVGDAFGDIARHRTAFMREPELAEWLRSHRHDRLTRQDVINHVLEAYPAFAATKSPAALKVWTSRFLKRHLTSTAAGGKSGSASKSSSDMEPQGSNTSGVVSEASGEAPALSSLASVQDDAESKPQDAVLPLEQAAASTSESAKVASTAEPASEAAGKTRESRPATSRKRRGACAGGYVLHSNEFKLNALRKLDEGKSVSEVAQELGLKSQNSLTYWNSIRDKLVTSEKKRFRIAGGGRRSSCTFEGELLMWVSERHQKGLGTWSRSLCCSDGCMRDAHDVLWRRHRRQGRAGLHARVPLVLHGGQEGADAAQVDLALLQALLARADRDERPAGREQSLHLRMTPVPDMGSGWRGPLEPALCRS